jgi:transposase
MATLIDDLVPDRLWAMVAPLLPVPPRPRFGGRHLVIPDRNCFAAIIYMARTSTPWRLLPARELGCGSPATCWRRLTEWANAGVFDQLHLEVLDRLGEQGGLDGTPVGGPDHSYSSLDFRPRHCYSSAGATQALIVLGAVSRTTDSRAASRPYTPICCALLPRWRATRISMGVSPA